MGEASLEGDLVDRASLLRMMFRSDAAETFAQVAIYAEARLAEWTGIECVGRSRRTDHCVRSDCSKRREFPPEWLRPRYLPNHGRKTGSLDTLSPLSATNTGRSPAAAAIHRTTVLEHRAGVRVNKSQHSLNSRKTIAQCALKHFTNLCRGP